MRSTACRTSSRVLADTSSGRLRARETVIRLTPAKRATSLMVICLDSGWRGWVAVRLVPDGEAAEAGGVRVAMRGSIAEVERQWENVMVC